jgi:hypothetical protein
MYRVTAYYGDRMSVFTVLEAEDIVSATINAELAYSNASMIVVEAC